MKHSGSLWTDRATDPRWALALGLVLFGWNLWAYDLWAPDEPFFAEGAREMIVDGEWLVPHINGEINTHKPPLFFWLIALFSLPFGAVLSLTARLPSVLAALGTLALTLRLGRRMAGPRTADRRTAVLAGAMLATTYLFWDKARSAQIDALLCFLILVALTAFEGFRAGDWPGRRAGVVFWAAAGLAVLAKGPVGLLLPLGVAAVTLAADRKLASWRRFAPLAGPLVFLAVTGAWAGATLVWGGEYSVWGALREHAIDRAVHGMHHKQPFWYYAKVLPYALLPWSFLVPGALLLAWRRRRQGADRFLLVFALFVVLFFSVSTEKRDLYILPAVPAFALLAARLVAAISGWWPAADECAGAVPGRRWVTVPQGVVGSLMALAAVAAPMAAARTDDALVAPAYALAAVLGVGGLGILATAVRGWPLTTVGWSAAAMALAMLTAVTFVYPAMNPMKSGRELALVVRDASAASRAAGRPVLALDAGNAPKPVNLYSNGVYVKELATPEKLVAELAAGDETYLLTSERTLREVFPEGLPEHMTILYSTRLSSRNILFVRFAPSPQLGSPP